MFRFKSLLRFLSVWFGIIFILSISPVSAADKPEIFVQMGHTDSISTIAFSPDGKYILSGSMDKTLKLWDVSTGREIRTFKYTKSIYTLAFSPDGKLAVSNGGPGNVLLWDSRFHRLLSGRKAFYLFAL